MVITLILSFLGFLDATYLTILHYKNIIPPCSLAHGCDIVLTSKYATFFGIPIALLGVLYYTAIIGLLTHFLQNKNKITLKLLLCLSTSGFIVSVILVAIQAFILHAFCQYCLGVEGINTVILFLLLSKYKTNLAFSK